VNSGAALTSVKRLEKTRIAGSLIIIAGTVLALVLDAWPAAIGVIFGGVVALGWGSTVLKRSLAKFDAAKANPSKLPKGVLFVQAFMGTVPCAIVGVIALVVALSHPIIGLIAGLFLAMAFSFVLLYWAMWMTLRIIGRGTS
jgi:hypothetical protein